MEKPVSTYTIARALEEIKDTENQFLDLLPMRHLSLSNISSDLQPASHVVVVSGNITVSF